DVQADRHRQHDREGRDQAAAEAPEQVVALLHRRGEEQLCGALLEVADRDAGDEDGRQQHADDAERAEDGNHHRRRVAHDVADATADADVAGGHGAEPHQRVDRDDDPEHPVPEQLAQFESQQVAQHGQAAFATAASAAAARRSSPKYTSSRSGGTAVKPSPGLPSLSTWITGWPATRRDDSTLWAAKCSSSAALSTVFFQTRPSSDAIASRGS